jgi:hypothetical protein
MKNYNLLLWGAVAFVAWRYLKKKNGAPAITTAPEALQPLQPMQPVEPMRPIVTYKPSEVVSPILPNVQAAPMPKQMQPQEPVKRIVRVPPSESFKPGQL